LFGDLNIYRKWSLGNVNLYNLNTCKSISRVFDMLSSIRKAINIFVFLWAVDLLVLY